MFKLVTPTRLDTYCGIVTNNSLYGLNSQTVWRVSSK